MVVVVFQLAENYYTLCFQHKNFHSFGYIFTTINNQLIMEALKYMLNLSNRPIEQYHQTCIHIFPNIERF